MSGKEERKRESTGGEIETNNHERRVREIKGGEIETNIIKGEYERLKEEK